MKTPLLTMLTVFLMSLFLQVNSAQAQLNNCNNCTAKDIKAIGLRADIGTQSGCVQSNIEVSPDLYVDFEVTSSERYGFYLAYEVWVVRENGTSYQFTTGSTNGVFVQTICATNDTRPPGDPTGSGGILKKGLFDLKLIAEPLILTGEKIELRNVLTAWGNQIQEVNFFCTAGPGGGLPLTDCGQVTPKCKYYPGTTLDVLITSKPTVQLTGNPGSICVGQNAVFKVTGTSGAGVTVTVHTGSAAGPIVATFTNFDGEEEYTVIAPPASVTLYANTTKTLSTPPCKGDATSGTITVNPNPTLNNPVGGTKCYDGTKITATATASAGASVVWYDAQTNGNVVADPSRTEVGTSTFWAEAVLGDCVSPRKSAVLVVKTTPVVNSATGAMACNTGQTLTATAVVTPSNSTITWWTLAVGGMSATNTQTGVGTKTIWAQATLEGCTSTERKSATLTIKETPTVTGVTPASKCYDGTKATASATASAGATIVWFDAATNGNVVADPSRTEVGTSTFWAEAQLNGCNSLARTSATVEIKETPTVTGVTPAAKCYDGTKATATATASAGATIVWYDAATNGNVVADPSRTVVGTSTFWAEAVKGDCKSASRTSATVIISETPTVNGVTPAEKCYDGTKATATATASAGATIVWYDAATNGNVVADPSRTAVGVSTFWAEATLGNCKSAARTSATVTIKETPTVISTQGATACNSGQTLTATAVVSAGATLTWWNAATAGSQTSNTLTGVGEKTVWAQADLNGCTSTSRMSALLKIKITPTITAGPNQDVCYTGQTLTATANASDGATIVWYEAASGGSPVTPTLSSIGTKTYYAEAVLDGCKSTSRAAVTLKLKNCDPGFCTYTQGAFGNQGGKDKFKWDDGMCKASTGGLQTVNIALSRWTGGMPVANMVFVAYTGDAQIIQDYLPNGGPSKTYTGNKSGLMSQKNTLLAQTITLGLNIGLNLNILDYELPVGTWYLSTAKSSNCGGTIEAGASDQCFKFVVSSNMDVVGPTNMGPGDGKVTVRDIWVLANRGLMGSGTNGVSLSAIAGVADAIANAFDECRIPTNWTREDPCAASKLLASLILLESPSAVNVGANAKNLTVKAYPNPFKDRVFINFTSPVSGKATVEIFDMTGRRLEMINKGQVIAGRENTVEYNVPSFNRNSIIYKVTVDKFSVNGRLISPGK